MENLNDFVRFLGLKKPVHVTLKNRAGKDCDAYYLPRYNDAGKLVSHRITIFTVGNSRPLAVLLAHELIHAKQEELQKQEIHGRIFKKWAKAFYKNFALEDIFIKGIDE